MTENEHWILAPSKSGIVPKAKMIQRKRPDNDRVQIQAFNQHPEEVRHKQVVEQWHNQLAQSLSRRQNMLAVSIIYLMETIETTTKNEIQQPHRRLVNAWKSYEQLLS